MKLKKSDAIAKSKNGKVNIVSLGAKLRKDCDASLSTHGDDWEIKGASDEAINACLADYDGEPLPVNNDIPASVVIRDGAVYAAGSDGSDILIKGK